MDQVHSLINRLTRQVAANVHSAELLATIEMLRQEIVKAGAPVVKQGQSVFVWMPSPINQPKTNGQLNGHAATPETGIKPEKANTEEVQEIPVPDKKQEHIAMPAVPRQVYTAPTPPVVARNPAPEIPEHSFETLSNQLANQPVIQQEITFKTVPVEEIAEAERETKAEVELSKEDHEEFVLQAEPTEEELANQAYRPKIGHQTATNTDNFPAPEINHAFMKVQEQAAAKHAQLAGTMEAPAARAEATFSNFHGLESRVKKTFPVAPPPSSKKEINELLVDDGMALNQKLKTGHIELGEALASGPRITDLRKAFGINDRYQFINGLFRGDADMFDRSMRTLNNFGNHQEASFWMQRELVIKLGWNEEDELVQQFYKILGRRF